MNNHAAQISQFTERFQYFVVDVRGIMQEMETYMLQRRHSTHKITKVHYFVAYADSGGTLDHDVESLEFVDCSITFRIREKGEFDLKIQKYCFRIAIGFVIVSVTEAIDVDAKGVFTV